MSLLAHMQSTPDPDEDKLSWESVRWPDGSSYEGLVKDDMCHVRGVMKYRKAGRQG